MNSNPEKRMREHDESVEQESLSDASPPPPFTSTPGKDHVEPLLQWREILEEFDNMVEKAIYTLREKDRNSVDLILHYLLNCIATLTNAFHNLRDALPPSEIKIGEHVLRASPAVVIRLKNKLQLFKETGKGCNIIFSPIEYSPAKILRAYPATVRAASMYFGDCRPNLSMNASVQPCTILQAPLTPGRNVLHYGGSESGPPCQQRERHPGARVSLPSLHREQTSGREPYTMTSEELLLEHEMTLYATLPRPWNEIPTLIPRKHHVDVGRYIASAENRTFNGDIDKYTRWRADFLNNLGAVKCLARYKVSALSKALHTILETLTSKDTPDFEGYRAVILALEERFGNRYVLTRRFEKYFEIEGAVKYGNLLAFEEYRVKVEQFKHFLETTRDMSSSEDYVYEKLLRPLAEQYLEEYGTWLIATFKEESVSALEEWIACRIKRLRRYQIPRTTTHTPPTRREKVKILLEEEEREIVRREEDSSLGSFEEVESEDKILLSKVRLELKNDCPLACESEHTLDECPRFNAIPVQKRKAIMFNWRVTVCFRCLGKGHVSGKCRTGSVCSLCNGLHHTLLHPEETSTTETTMCVTLSSVTDSAALPVLLIHMSNPKNSELREVAALVDTGSSITIVKECVAKQLHLTGPELTLSIQTAGGRVKQKAFVADVRITSSDRSNSWSVPVLVFRDSKLFEDLSAPTYSAEWKHLRHLPLMKLANKEIEILIGDDLSYLTAVKKSITGKGIQEPIGEYSLLGWSVRGPLRRASPTLIVKVLNLESAHLIEQEDFALQALKKRIEEAWDFPFDEPKEHLLRDSEKEAASILKKTLTLNTFQRKLTGGVLWKGEEPPYLPNNRIMALRRYKSLQRFLDKDPSIRKQYENNFQEWIDSGKLVKATPAEEGHIYYLCHFPVIRLDKDTSKVRTVVDASASYRGSSLNDFIHPGPNLCNDVRKVLLRFRREKVAFMADVKSMFLQIHLLKQDQSYHRILWNFGSNTPTDWQFTCFCFGNTCSPAVAISATHKLANTIPRNISRARESIIHSTVMDDTVDSTSSVKEAIQILEALHAAYARGGMLLRKFVSNSQEVLSHFPEELIQPRAKCVNLDASLEKSPLKTLGVSWWPNNDSFSISLSFHTQEIALTRRVILSLLARVYDPLGLVAPLLVGLKHLVQTSWNLKLDWDEKLPPPFIEKWEKATLAITGDLVLPIPRALIEKPIASLLRELHIFSDASSIAYGAVAYLVSRDDDEGNTRSVIVSSKSRIAPLRYATIPRLELQAACVAADLALIIMPELKLNPKDVYFWTDSQDVLYWLHSNSRTLKVFVAHRVAQLQAKTWIDRWKWTPTNTNPGDIISRGSSLEGLKNTTLWWNGPNFLTDKTQEPKQQLWTAKDVQIKETRKNKVYVLQNQTSTTDSLLSDLLQTTQNWIKMRKIIMFIYQWKNKGVRNQADITRAEQALLRLIQKEEWSSELKLLQTDASLPKNTLLYQYDPFVDGNGIIRVRGRLAYAEHLDWDIRHPILLPSQSSATTSLIRYIHEEQIHHLGGIRNLQSQVAERYCIPRGRELIKKVVHACIQCCKSSVKTTLPPWAPLPLSRLPENARTEAFQTVALDIMGPFTVTQEGEGEILPPEKHTRGRPRKFAVITTTEIPQKIRIKVYILVFSCLKFRASHLELIHSLKPEDIFMAMERFLVIRTRPTHIVSDNGTNFVASNRLLDPIWKGMEHSLQRKFPAVKWTFTTPGAAHTNGAVERIIGLAKIALGKALRNRKITLNEMLTAIKLVEGSLNNRPLQPMDGQEDNNILTPNHFIRGTPFTTFAPTDPSLNLLTSWSKVNEILGIYWSRFVREIVPTLNFGKCHKQAKNRSWKIGEIVLVKDTSNVKPYVNFPSWPIGKIIATYPGADGIIRSLKIRINGRDYVRNVSFVAPLIPQESTSAA